MKFTLIALSAIASANAFMAPGPMANANQLGLSNDYMGNMGGPEGMAGAGPERRLDEQMKKNQILEENLRKMEQQTQFLDQGMGGGYQPPSRDLPDLKRVADSTIIVQGGSLRTWSYSNPAVEAVLVELFTEGRPLDANIELWQGPNNTPHKMNVYVEDGGARRFRAFIDTPRGPNTVAIRNTGALEFPLSAIVEPERVVTRHVFKQAPETIQGGALRTYPFDPTIESVALLLKTDGRPLNARIELLQGPNNNKQVIELYTEDGLDRPFYAVIDTPGSGNVVRVVNTAPVEFPMTATVEPHEIGNYDVYGSDGVVMIGQ